MKHGDWTSELLERVNGDGRKRERLEARSLVLGRLRLPAATRELSSNVKHISGMYHFNSTIVDLGDEISGAVA